jgi:hypothetical protein
MASLLLIFAVSVFLAAYWFRHACRTVWATAQREGSLRRVANTNRLRFLEVEQTLSNGVGSGSLDSLHASLENDYRMLRFLLEHTSGTAVCALELRLLLVDFWLMRMLFLLMRRVSATRAAGALLGMSRVVGCLAACMERQVTSQTAT